MKAIFTALASAALAAAVPTEAQVATTAAGAGAVTAPSSSPVLTTGTVPATSAPTIAGPAGSGTVNVPPGTPPPAGRIPIPGIGGSRGPVLNVPPNTGAPLGSPNGPAALGFPPAPGTIRPVVTNTGIGGFAGQSRFSVPEAQTFPTGPVTVGNTVGQNFVAPATNFPPRRSMSVNLPPGAAVRENSVGIPEPFIPPATIPTLPENTIGAPAGPEIGAGGSTVAPIAPPPPAFRPPTALPPRPEPMRNPGARIPTVPRPVR